MSNCVVRPQIPYTGAIPGGIHDGKLIQIRGTVPYGCDVFHINLNTGFDVCSDRALHISVRFNGRVVVRNALIRDDWGPEERGGPFPFMAGRDFTVAILVQGYGYKIAVDNRHCWEFSHRVPYTRVNTIYIDGQVQIERIEFISNGAGAYRQPVISYSTPYGYPYPSYRIHHHYFPSVTPGTCVQPPNYYPSPGQIDPGFYPGTCVTPAMPCVTPSIPCVAPPPPTAPINTSSNLTPVYNPPIPYAYPIYGGIKPGMMIYISGRPTASSYKFTINLQAGTETYPEPDIAFHFDARFFNHTIVRNTRANGNWANEEVAIPYFPFNYAVNFDMIIRVESDKFMVALNGQHFIEFRHRMWPLSRFNTLYIENDIVVSSIRFA